MPELTDDWAKAAVRAAIFDAPIGATCEDKIERLAEVLRAERKTTATQCADLIDWPFNASGHVPDVSKGNACQIRRKFGIKL